MRNGCKEDWAGGEIDFIQRMWCSYGIPIDRNIESLLLCSVADYGVIAIVGRLSTRFLMCGR
jgi:hypothetical protein